MRAHMRCAGACAVKVTCTPLSVIPHSGRTPIQLILVSLWRSWREAEAAHWRRSSDLRALGAPHHPSVRLRRLRRDACTAALFACSSFVQNCAELCRSRSTVLAVHACDALGMPVAAWAVDQPLCDASDALHARMPLPARPHALHKTPHRRLAELVDDGAERDFRRCQGVRAGVAWHGSAQGVGKVRQPNDMGQCAAALQGLGAGTDPPAHASSASLTCT